MQVAGTNGKGSTSHYIAAILRAPAGGWGCSPRRTCRTCASASASTAGRSPRPISPTPSATCAPAARSCWPPGRIANLPTFFETLFLAALRHFASAAVDWAVLEVGLGGRLDATSTVMPEVAVITNIALDHTEILGKTLAAIAREKAGIARPGVPAGHAAARPAPSGRGSSAPPPAPAGRRWSRPSPRRGRLEVEKRRDGYDCRYRGATAQANTASWCRRGAATRRSTPPWRWPPSTC